MRYLADDGEIFESEQQCCEHESRSVTLNMLEEQVKTYLDQIEGTDRSRSIAGNHITSWLHYDISQRPERYEEKADVLEGPQPSYAIEA